MMRINYTSVKVQLKKEKKFAKEFIDKTLQFSKKLYYSAIRVKFIYSITI